MLSLGGGHRYWLYAEPTDMRKGFDGLSGLVARELGRDPLSGEVFLFVNRGRNRMKLLLWEEGGFVLWYKRLEAGTFELPRSDGKSKSLTISWTSLLRMIEGVELMPRQKRKRYSLKKIG